MLPVYLWIINLSKPHDPDSWIVQCQTQPANLEEYDLYNVAYIFDRRGVFTPKWNVAY